MFPVVVDPIPGSRSVLYVGEGSLDLPALVFTEGTILTRWALSDEEIASLVTNKCIDLWCWSYGKPIQPVQLQVVGHEYPPEETF